MAKPRNAQTHQQALSGLVDGSLQRFRIKGIDVKAQIRHRPRDRIRTRGPLDRHPLERQVDARGSHAGDTSQALFDGCDAAGTVDRGQRKLHRRACGQVLDRRDRDAGRTGGGHGRTSTTMRC